MAKRPHRIDAVLRRTLRRMDLDTRLEGYRVWHLWEGIVGEEIARRAQPERLRNQILFVRVSNSTWMQQLQTMKPMLLEKIHETVKGARIADIRFFLGEIVPSTQVPLTSGPVVEPGKARLSAEMEACLERIEDRELKTLVRSIMLQEAAKSMRGDGD